MTETMTTYNDPELVDFISAIERNEIPDRAPKAVYDYSSFGLAWGLEYFAARSLCTDRGMWAIVDKAWTGELAKWIDNRSVLEVMAGMGWLARSLHDFGVNIIATDNKSWENKHNKGVYVHSVEKLTALRAVKKYADRSDILLVSWPPYGNQSVVRVCEEWGTEKLVIYIGEGHGGCGAPDTFFEHFVIDDSLNIRIPQWGGLHDHLFLGRWDGKDS